MAQHPRVAAVFTEIRHWLVDRDDSAEPRIAQNLHKLYYLIFEQDLPVSVIPLQKWRKWQRRLMLTEEGRYNRVQPQEPIPVLMGLIEYYARKGSLYSKSNRDSTIWQDAQAMYERLGLPVPQEVLDKARDERENWKPTPHDLYQDWRDNNPSLAARADGFLKLATPADPPEQPAPLPFPVNTTSWSP